MKTLACLAIALSSVLASARADEGAYHSLVGMARSAQTDRGPEDGAQPADAAKAAAPDAAAPAKDPAGEAALRDALRDALADIPAQKSTATRRSTEPAPAPAPAPRLWTRLYSTLIPSWRQTPVLKSTYDAPASSAAAAGLRPLRALVPPPDSEAVKAGERRGLAELLSSSAVPADPR
jgi:hypothetical protein